MAIALVQKVSFNVSSGSTNQSFSVTPTVGNFIGVTVGGFQATSLTVTDNQGNTYTRDVGKNFSTVRAEIWHSPAIAHASGTFTISISGASSHLTGAISEFSGLTTSVPVVRTASSADSSSPLTVGPTADTTENDALILACNEIFSLGGAITIESVTPAWNALYNVSNNGDGHYKIVSTTGPQSCSWTTGAGGSAACCIAAFSDPVDYTPPRVTQIVQTVVSSAPASPIRATQVVQGIAYQGNLKLKLTQVVQTLVVIPGVAPGPIPPTALTPTNINAWKLLRFDLKKRDEEEA